MVSFLHRLKRWIFPFYRSQYRKLHDLRSLFLELTTGCNLNCLHCGSDCKKEASAQILPRESIRKLLEEIRSRYDPRRVFLILSGGEPLCYPKVFDLGREITNLGFPWGMVTNGFGWSKATIQQAKEAGMRSVTVSLDGLEDAHNWMRAHPDSFRRAVGTIEFLLRDRFWGAMDVITCANRRNLGTLDDLRVHLMKLGVEQWRIFTISPIGRAAGTSDLFLTPKEYQNLLRMIRLWREQGGIRVALSESGYLGRLCEFEGREEFFFCRAGISVAGVMANGDILACPNIDRRFRQGNIHEDSFVEVWENRYEKFRDRTWMRQGECAGCPEWRMCEGNSFHLWDLDASRPKLCHFRDYELSRYVRE